MATGENIAMKNRMNSGANATAAPAFMQYRPAPIMAMPAMPWQSDSTFWAWIFRSATMPMSAGMKMDTMPCMAKNHLICEPRPMLPR